MAGKESLPRMRFALLIRVSTEKQAQQGESLRTQEKQLSEAVNQLGGVVACKYAGQEHATEGWERELLEQLLTDAGRNPRLFDAVMVADPSRWSRDNVKSEVGLATLRDNGIKFFVQTTHYDLFRDESRFFLALQSTINSFQARVQVRKSLENRINRAKRGVPAAGSMPYGRTYDKIAGWSVDPIAKATMDQIAKRYLNGESLVPLAEEFGIKETTLHDRLAKCGPKLTARFRSKSLNIDETVTIDVPPLLDEETILAVRQRCEANKTYTHGQLKHRYLLSRMVFCSFCHSALSGQFSNGQRYYRHLSNGQRCQLGGHVRADDLEETVIRQLFECFGNPVAVQRAIEAATPNPSEVAVQREKQSRMIGELKKIEDGRERVLSLVASDQVTREQAANQLENMKTREYRLKDELKKVEQGLGNIPSPEKIKSISMQIAAGAAANDEERFSIRPWIQMSNANHNIDKMTWDERRALVEMVFGGHTVDGRRMGITVEPRDATRRAWPYTIQGHFIEDSGITLAMTDDIDEFFCYGAPHFQKALLKKPSGVTTPGRSAPIPPQKYSHPCRSTHRAGE